MKHESVVFCNDPLIYKVIFDAIASFPSGKENNNLVREREKTL